ncbi:MAG: group II intron reverse transcriptase/maturase [Thermodesulfobacteriota bacterium]
MDKVYQMKNLELAWKKVKANRGAGGIDGESLEEFEAEWETKLHQLHEELKTGTYRPQPVRQKLIPKPGQPGKERPLGIPTIYDRVCQQALLNRLGPIFEPVFDEANFGYRPGRSPKDALRKVWKEIESGCEWIVDADLRDFFGSADHEKLMSLLAQRIADGRVLELIESTLKAGGVAQGRRYPTDQGTPQGAVVSPLLSNILLTPFDREMRWKGYRLTRWADDWVITCKSRAEAQAALDNAKRVLARLGVTLHKEKTRIVHIQHGFEFLGFKIKKASRGLRLPAGKLSSRVQSGQTYAYPREKSVEHFKEQIRRQTRRNNGESSQEVITAINPIIRGWGNYYCKAHVRRLFNRLKGWIERRIWSHRHKRWRNTGWRHLPPEVLYGRMGLVNLIALIPSLGIRRR